MINSFLFNSFLLNFLIKNNSIKKNKITGIREPKKNKFNPVPTADRTAI